MLKEEKDVPLKSLSEYSFSEFVDMKKETFDKVMEQDTSNIGFLTNLRKLLSLQYDCIRVQINALSTRCVESTDEFEKSQCVTTIQNMYGILFSLEYKACCIYNKIKESQSQIT